MQSIHDFAPLLSIGSLADCRFDDGSMIQLEVAGVTCYDGKNKVVIGVPDEVNAVLEEAFPSQISENLLLEFGFSKKEDSIPEYSIVMRGTLSLVLRPVLGMDGKYSVFVYLSKPDQPDEVDSIMPLGRIQYFFKIQDIYRSFSSKNLLWKKSQ